MATTPDQIYTVQEHRALANLAFGMAADEWERNYVANDYFTAQMQFAQFHATMALSASED